MKAGSGDVEDCIRIGMVPMGPNLNLVGVDCFTIAVDGNGWSNNIAWGPGFGA